MPKEVMVLLLFLGAFAVPILITYMVMMQKRWKMEFNRQNNLQSTEDGLSMKELKAAIKEVVLEANEPLVKRLTALEKASLAAVKSAQRIDASLLYEDMYETAEDKKTVGKKNRV